MGRTTDSLENVRPRVVNRYCFWLTVATLYLAPMGKLVWEIGFRLWLADIVFLCSVALLAGGLCLGHHVRLRIANLTALFLVAVVSMLPGLLACDLTMLIQPLVSLLLPFTIALLIVLAVYNLLAHAGVVVLIGVAPWM